MLMYLTINMANDVTVLFMMNQSLDLLNNQNVQMTIRPSYNRLMAWTKILGHSKSNLDGFRSPSRGTCRPKRSGDTEQSTKPQFIQMILHFCGATGTLEQISIHDK
jgi:hypothetical protein